MTVRCPAVYENGVLRPLTQPQLKEGQHVDVIIVSQEENAHAKTGETPIAKILADIASMPLEVADQGFSGRDHDRILYGDRGSK